MAAYLRNVPNELIEAARVDGSASVLQILLRVIVPICRSVLAVPGIINFIWMWNDILLSVLIMQTTESRTLMIAAGLMRAQWGSSSTLISAGLALAVVPVVVMFLLAQRQIIQGMTVGAVKWRQGKFVAFASNDTRKRTPRMRIDAIEVFNLRYELPVHAGFRYSGGRLTGRVTSLVKVSADGLIGCGAAYSHPDLVRVVIEIHLKPLLLGKDPTDTELLWQQWPERGLRCRRGPCRPRRRRR
jgi:hypothetical protein